MLPRLSINLRLLRLALMTLIFSSVVRLRNSSVEGKALSSGSSSADSRRFREASVRIAGCWRVGAMIVLDL